MSLYTECIDKILKGNTYNLRLKDSLKIGDETIVSSMFGVAKKYKKKELINSKDLIEFGINDCLSNPLDVLDELYAQYKVSTPELLQGQRKRKTYFRAKDFNELTEDEKINGGFRLKHQAVLELYVLFINLTQGFDISAKKFFYQSKKDKQFIMLKQWYKANLE